MKQSDLISRVRWTIRKHHLLEAKDKVVVAVSGGADSVCLVSVLLGLKDEFGISLHIAHLDHGLRGEESDADARWVEALAHTLELPITVERRDVQKRAKNEKGSLEELAREIRYAFLSEVADEVQAEKIAVGHTLNDQAETVLLSLIRGAGIRGVRGMLPRLGKVIRPLIEVSRDEVVAHLRSVGLAYREDSSNLEARFLRNRLRSELIPLMKSEFNSRVLESLSRYAELAGAEDSYLETVARGAFSSVLLRRSPTALVLDWRALARLHPALARRVVRTAIEEMKGDLRRMRSGHILSALRLSTGRRLCLPCGLVVEREYGELIISAARSQRKGFEYALRIPGEIVVTEIGMSVVTDCPNRSWLPSDLRAPSRDEAYFDLDGLRPPLVIRNRRKGDRIRLFGMGGEKKVKDIFIDDKIARSAREKIPILSDEEGILWIVGSRRAERARITKDTTRIVRVRAMRTSEV